MRDFLAPHYQPIFTRSGDVFAYEAFMRIKGDSCNSARFVPRWERSNLIASADAAMVEQVSIFASQSAHRDKLRFSLNISPVSIETEHRAVVTRLAALRRLTRGVIAEVRYPTSTQNFNYFIEFIQQCKYNRIGIAMEDAQLDTVFSGTAFITTVRPEFVKVNSGYLTRIYDTPIYPAFLRRIELAASVGVQVIVKNVDSTEARSHAYATGATYLQGRLFGAESKQIVIIEDTQGSKSASKAAPAPRTAPRSSIPGRLSRAITPLRRILTRTLSHT